MSDIGDFVPPDWGPLASLRMTNFRLNPQSLVSLLICAAKTLRALYLENGKCEDGRWASFFDMHETVELAKLVVVDFAQLSYYEASDQNRWSQTFKRLYRRDEVAIGGLLAKVEVNRERDELLPVYIEWMRRWMDGV